MTWLLGVWMLAQQTTETTYNSPNSPYRLPNCHKFEYQLAKNPVEYQKNCITDQMQSIGDSLEALSEWNIKIIRSLIEFGNSDEPVYQMKNLKNIQNCRDYLRYMFHFARKYPRSSSSDFSEMERSLKESVQAVISDFFNVFNLIKNYDNALFFKDFQLKASFFNFFKDILNKLTPLIQKIVSCRSYDMFLDFIQEVVEYLAVSCEFRSLFLSNLKNQVQF